MAKLRLNIPLMDEEGKPVVPSATLAKVLGSTMLKSGNTVESDILKFFTWALELGKSGEIELDKADSVFLNKYIVEEPNLFIIVKAPIMQEIENLKFK